MVIPFRLFVTAIYFLTSLLYSLLPFLRAEVASRFHDGTLTPTIVQCFLSAATAKTRGYSTAPLMSKILGITRLASMTVTIRLRGSLKGLVIK